MSGVLELDARGHLSLDLGDPAAQAYAERLREGAEHVTIANGVLGAILDAHAQGVRVLLVKVAATGGLYGAGALIYDALRRFSYEGGRVVTYVEAACSAGILVALAGDVVVVEGGFGAHGSLGCGAPAGTLDNRSAAEADAGFLRVIMERTATPRATAEEWLTAREEADVLNLVALGPRAAVAYGWADGPGDLEWARLVAQALANGATPPTKRAQLLAARAQGVERAAELFGEAIRQCPAPPWVKVPRAERGSTAPGFLESTYAATLA